MTDAPAATQQPIQIVGGAEAPVIFFDGVAALGTYGGIGEIETALRILKPLPDGQTVAEVLIVARLRFPVAAISALKDAVQKIETMLTPPDAKPN